jgi:large subunit ribosomal protein L9
MANNVKVVFKADIRGIAKAGDVKNVSPGYARNYLFPRQLAFPATDAALRQWETVKQGTLAKAERKRDASRTVAEKIGTTPCTFTLKASPEGKLFGSVGKHEILTELAKQGITLDKHALELTKPIKQVGTSTVTVQLPSGVQAALTVTITAENS